MKIDALANQVSSKCGSESLDDFVNDFNGSPLGGSASTIRYEYTTFYVEKGGDTVCVTVRGCSNTRELITEDVDGSPVLPPEPDVPRFPLEPDPVPPSWEFQEVLEEHLAGLESSGSQLGVERTVEVVKHGWWSPKTGKQAAGRMILRTYTATFTIFEKKVR